MIWLYQALFPFVALGILAKIALAGRARALREGGGELSQRLGLIPDAMGAGLREKPGERLVWLHAASVGEVLAAAPLLKALAASKNAPRVLMTTTTVAGRDKALSVPEVDAAVLAPMDFFPCIREFLKRAKPDALVLIEKELWPMTLRCAAEAGVPIAIANGTMSERTLGRYSRLGGLFPSLLAPVRRAAVQDDDAAKRFAALGVDPGVILSAGNVKYDQLPPGKDAVETAKRRLEELGWSDLPVWVAGSTRRGEEQILAAAHKLAAGKLENLRWVLAPRHPERVREVERVLRESGIRFARWSEPLAAEPDPRCLLIDEIGLLGSLYACASVSFVGGTLVDIGGHNVLEPAISGSPVLFGPYTGKVREVARGLLDTGGGKEAGTAEELGESLAAFAAPGTERERALEGARRAAERFSGAAARTLEHLRPVLLGTD
jgi:3-deoxy-D-manno-octulosonic-acid transferase